MGQVIQIATILTVAKTQALVNIARELIETLGSDQHPEYAVAVGLAQDMVTDAKTVKEIEKVSDFFFTAYVPAGNSSL